MSSKNPTTYTWLTAQCIDHNFVDSQSKFLTRNQQYLIHKFHTLSALLNLLFLAKIKKKRTENR
uniref:Uncharacterized protein n=1 Tax=Rhizophora mucronata TaxID=61149 RepID=A0A2P2N3A6_RHIMU